MRTIRVGKMDADGAIVFPDGSRETSGRHWLLEADFTFAESFGWQVTGAHSCPRHAIEMFISKPLCQFGELE